MVKFFKKMNGVLNASESSARLSLVKEQAIKTGFFITDFLCRYCCLVHSSFLITGRVRDL